MLFELDEKAFTPLRKVFIVHFDNNISKKGDLMLHMKNNKRK
jgi:hypothetical protein